MPSLAWRQANPEKARAQRNAWAAANREKVRASVRKWEAANPDKVKAGQKRWRAANRDKVAGYQRKWKKLPTATRPRPEFCECCGFPETVKGRTLALDHDHETGVFRGWLCSGCNTAIGRLGDSVEGLQKALRYLTGAGAKDGSVR